MTTDSRRTAAEGEDEPGWSDATPPEVSIEPVELTVSMSDLNGDVALLHELTGRRQTWVSACSDVVTDRSVATVTQVRDENGSYLRALHASGNTIGGGWSEAVENFDLRAAYAIRALAEGLADPAESWTAETLQQACEPILDHCDEARLHSVAPGAVDELLELLERPVVRRRRFWRPGGPTSPAAADPQHRRLAELIRFVGATGRPSADYVALLAAHLAKRLPEPVDVETVRVLLADDPSGWQPDDAREQAHGPGFAGRLTLSRLPGGPPGLHPDPRSVAFFDSDDDRFVVSATHAWASSRFGASRGGRDACILWSLEADQPCNQFDGGSLGGAFAVGLDALGRRSTGSALQLALRRSGLGLQRLRVDPRSAVTATVTQDAVLGPVDYLSRKVEAAARDGVRLLVVSSADRVTAARAAEPFGIRVEGAATVAEAVNASRRDHDPRFRRLVQLAGVLGVLLLVVAVVAGYALTRVVRSQAASDRLMGSYRLLDEAARLRSTQPEVALRLGVAAAALAPTAANRAAVLETLAGTAYAGTVAELGGVPAVTVSRDGRTVADGSRVDTVGPGHLSLWSLDGDGHMARLADVPTRSEVRGVTFAPGDRVLATAAADATVTLWDVSDRSAPRVLANLTDQHGPVQQVSFDKAGRLLATASHDGTVALYDVADPAHPQLLHVLSGHVKGAWTASFSPDGTRLATGDENGTLYLFDVRDPRDPRRLASSRQHSDIVRSAAFANGGQTLVTASLDGSVKVWDVAADGALSVRQTLREHTGKIFQLAVAPDQHTVVSVGYDRTGVVYDVPARGLAQPLTTLRGHTGYIRAVAFTPDSRRIITGSLDGTMMVWNVAGNQPDRLAQLLDPGRVAGAVALSPDERIMAVGDSVGSMSLYDLADPAHPRHLATVDRPRDDVRGLLPEHNLASLTFNPAGTVLVGTSWDNSVRMWDVSRPEDPRTLPVVRGHVGAVYAVAFSSTGGLMATGGQDGTFALYDTSDPEDVRWLNSVHAHQEAVISVGFGAGDRQLLTGGIDRVAKTWDLADLAAPRLVQTIGGHDEAVFAAYSPDRSRIAVSSADSTTSLLATDGRTATPLSTFSGHTSNLRAQTFSSDGQLLATGGEDGLLAVFGLTDPTNPTAVASLSPAGDNGKLTPEARFVMATSAGTHTLASAGGDGTVSLYDISRLDAMVADPLGTACGRIGHGLTPQEWHDRLPEVPYVVTCPS